MEEGIQELKSGSKDIFWPGKVDAFALSAGTTGQGKHLPLTADRLKSDRRFMRKVILSYFRQRPNVFNILGSQISLPGSVEHMNGIRMGEISGFTALQAPRWLRWLQVADPAKLTEMEFREKFEIVLEQAVDKDIRVITAVPSWTLTLFQEVLQKTGYDTISELWPRLKLLVCGGVKLSNYRSHLEILIGNQDVDFIETYGASEGYFGYSDDLARKDLRLVTGNGIFYEFIADPLPDRESLGIQETIPLGRVEEGVPYAMVVSTNSGLWRYGLNDMVEFTQGDPPRIKVLGRVSEMLDDYGEALYIYEAREALAFASKQINMNAGSFSIGTLMEDERSIPRHIWFVQSPERFHPDTLERLAGHIDEKLRNINRHYAIRRESKALGKPEVHTITQSRINAWLQQSGKHKAQGKMPSILRDEQDIDFFKG